MAGGPTGNIPIVHTETLNMFNDRENTLYDRFSVDTLTAVYRYRNKNMKTSIKILCQNKWPPPK